MRGVGIRSYRECAVVAIVLCGHALLVLFFARAREPERNTIDTTHRSTLVLIAPRKTIPSAMPTETPAAIAHSTLIHISPPPYPSEPPALASDASASASAATPTIDWQREAEHSANHAIQMQVAPTSRAFQARAVPDPSPKARSFGWDPSPGKIGFSGGLPYLEIGKRCAVGLGFFGCGFGELPAANGKLFEDMDDPDRERSSVGTP
jgi:hypothetical protein